MIEAERYERWEPLAGLPEAPIRDFDCKFEGGQLSVIAHYASSGEGHQLRIDFDYVEAFKAYEEFSDPWMAAGLPLPQLEGVDQNWRWPLQEVMHSAWVARVLARNGGLEHPWWHFVISTMDFSLHVMTSGPPRNVELGSS